ncbi:MAG TPA: glycosyltransferase family 2 protein [Rhodothermales bacterium]
MQELDLTIVVPVYDEEASLDELARQIREVCDGQGWAFEVLMIDDGSHDASWSVIQRIHAADPRFNGIRFRRNYGKSAALSVGFARARGRYVVTMDADLQDDPHELPGLVAMLDEGNDLVSGWKRRRHDPLSKTIPSRLFNFVMRVISGIPIHDFNCGLKAYRREVAQHVVVYGELHRYIPMLAKWEGYSRIGEKVVQHHPRRYGHTKFGVERLIRGFLDLISVFFLTRFAARPMHFFGILGTLSFAGGFAIGLWLTIQKLFFNIYISNRPILLLGLLLMLLGAQFFSTGLLAEMVIVPRMTRTEAYDVAETLESPVAEPA